jgi:hypothetical protein
MAVWQVERRGSGQVSSAALPRPAGGSWSGLCAASWFGSLLAGMRTFALALPALRAFVD